MYSKRDDIQITFDYVNSTRFSTVLHNFVITNESGRERIKKTSSKFTAKISRPIGKFRTENIWGVRERRKCNF